MTGKDRKPSPDALASVLRVSSWVIVALVVVGIALIALSVIIVGLQVLSQSTFLESILILTVVFVFTIGYWYVTIWFEKNGIGPWNEGRNELIGPDDDEGFEEQEL